MWTKSFYKIFLETTLVEKSLGNGGEKQTLDVGLERGGALLSQPHDEGLEPVLDLHVLVPLPLPPAELAAPLLVVEPPPSTAARVHHLEILSFLLPSSLQKLFKHFSHLQL